MRVHEYAKANGLTVAEVKDRFNLKSHMSVVPETESKEQAGGVIITTMPPKYIPDPTESIETESQVDPAIVELSIRMLANKSPYWKG